MACAKPYKLINARYPEGLDCPCRGCMACRVSNSSEWALRLIHELPYFDNAVFITLTYDNDHLPRNYSLDKSHLVKYIKRIRKHLSKTIENPKTKYFACGEYGEQTHRPHYHLIFFGLGIQHHDFLQEYWREGAIHTGTVTKESIGYVTAYINKKLTGKQAEENYRDTKRIAPFKNASQGMGLRYAQENQEQIKELLFIPHNGQEKPIPVYYRRKLEIDNEKIIELAIENSKRVEDYHKNKTNITKEILKPDFFKPKDTSYIDLRRTYEKYTERNTDYIKITESIYRSKQTLEKTLNQRSSQKTRDPNHNSNN